MNKKRKTIWIVIATNLLGIAITCFLESGLGCDPIALLSSGIANALHVSFGVASFIYNVVTILLACVFAKKELGSGTIVYGLLSGFVIDIFGYFFVKLHIIPQEQFMQIVFFVIGEIFMSLAFAILMHMHLGMTALDALLTRISQYTHITYALCKILMDAIFVITGIVLGGAFGIGTIISVMTTGILVSLFGKLFTKYYETQISI